MYKIGVDIGGMSAKIGLCDREKIIAGTRVTTGADIEFSYLAEKIAEAISSIVSPAEYDFIGIASCGLIDSEKGAVTYANNVPWKDAPLAATLRKLTGKKTKIANDARCAALCEGVYGVGKNKRMCLFTLGTGVGGGFTDCGKLQSGSAFADASDIFGHVTVEKNGRQCTCGRKGCLEAYASATAVMKENERRGGGKLTAKEIFDLARSGEKTQKEIVEEFTDYLAEGIADVVNVLRPETMAIGGGLSAAADLYLGNLEKKVNERIFGGDYLPVKIEKAAFGNDAGIIGATLLENGL